MKMRIDVEPEIVQPLQRVNVRRANSDKAFHSRITPKLQLDRPPNGDRLLNGFRRKSSLASAEDHPNDSLHILLIEDDASLCKIYSRVLKLMGHHVHTAGNGEAGWQVLSTPGATIYTYDLLITDNQLPKLSGIALIQRLRLVDLEFPVILMSGVLPANLRPLHLTAFLLLPFSTGQLIQTVRDVPRKIKHE